MTHDPRLDDIEIGELDGIPFRISPRYRGTLTETERLGMIASSVRFLLDAVRYGAAGAPRCSGQDCDPASHAVLSSLRREVTDALALSLNFGFIPSDLTKFVRAVGVAVGVTSADACRLAEELHDLIRAYEWASGTLVTGGAWLFAEDDDEDLPRYVAWGQWVTGGSREEKNRVSATETRCHLDTAKAQVGVVGVAAT